MKELQTSFDKFMGSSVVDCLMGDQRATGSSLTGVTALCPWARHINTSLVLVQPRKTRPFITERLVMGRKESNQTKIDKFMLKFYSHCIHLNADIKPQHGF